MDARPLLDYTVIRTVVVVLAGLGLVMVTSSSMAASFAASSSVWSTTLRQALMVSLGLVLFWVMLRISPERVRALANAVMIVAIALLILVLIPGIGTGRDEVGSQSWLVVGPLRLQPSEFARAAIAVWGAKLLANKDYREPSRLANGFVGFTMVAGLCLLLITAQGDLGMAVNFAIVVAFILLFAGISTGFIAFAAIAGFIGLIVVFFAGGYRSDRFHVYFDALFGHFDDTRGIAFQSHQGFLSLADGSLFGVGLGQSRAKWFYLPEARNDFIFAVIGEELGLWGGALVIGLFALLGYFGLRAARRAQNQFQTLMAASLAAGVVSQAFINIGYVVGLLPVTGIQLPMVSAGGTSAVITLASMGILASIARHEPDAVSAMQNYGRPAFDRMLGIGEPTTPGQTRAARREQDARNARSRREARFGTPVTARSGSALRRPAGAPQRDMQKDPQRYPHRGAPTRSAARAVRGTAVPQPRSWESTASTTRTTRRAG
nr:FtsW/RodA/SpoVE family cell cycle protein [Corynebacterium timonense]